MADRKSTSIYTRERGGEERFYGDFRAYSDVGGGREALVDTETGKKRGTTDREVAERLYADRLQALKRKRNLRGTGVLTDAELNPEERGLKRFAAHHLRMKARSGSVTDGWLRATQRQLQRAVDFFGSERDIATISPDDCGSWAAALAETPNGRGGTLSGGTVRHHLNGLSNLYRRALSEGYVTMNPVAAMMEKPSARRVEADWFEVSDAALILEAARVHRPERGKEHQSITDLHAIVATFLLTGGRKSEVLGLAVDDVSFDRGTITFRPNEYRRLKTSTSHRSVPMWPQLREVLQEHVFGSGRVSGLLFPSPAGTGRITDLRKSLDAVGERCGFAEGEIRTKGFRHTYCAARLQTLDRGAPVSPWTVAKEMGHGGRSLVDRVYGHLGDVRHRSEVVEYDAAALIERWTERAEDAIRRAEKADQEGEGAKAGQHRQKAAEWKEKAERYRRRWRDVVGSAAGRIPDDAREDAAI